MHSTSNLIDGNFDSSGLLRGKQQTDSFGLEQGKIKDKSSSSPYYDSHYEASQTKKAESLKYSFEDTPGETYR